MLEVCDLLNEIFGYRPNAKCEPVDTASMCGEGTVAESGDGEHSAPFRNTIRTNTSFRVTSARSRNDEGDCLRASKSPHLAKN